MSVVYLCKLSMKVLILVVAENTSLSWISRNNYIKIIINVQQRSNVKFYQFKIKLASSLVFLAERKLKYSTLRYLCFYFDSLIISGYALIGEEWVGG